MIRKGSRRIPQTALFLGLAIFLLMARPARMEESLYWAKSEDLPEWAEPGNFRFLRLDGGGIESRKAERTWWGKNFTDAEKDVLAHIYDRDFDRMLGLLEQAQFNWIWVTWSNGWSLQEESENRELIKKVIERCHENGIHVTAYMSASNMFWKSAFRDDPETRKLGLWMYGIPLFYAGLTKHGPSISWERRLADVRKPEWRAYLVHKAALAVDAGVDAIFFDNIIGDTSGMKLLLSEVQRMAEPKAAESGRPPILVYANVHLAPDRFEINDHCDLIWEEAGKDTPGVWAGAWQVGNVRKIKFLAGEKQAWQPLMYENDVYHCGPRETCIPTPAEQKVGIAEAYAFGAALSRNLEGRFLHGLITGEPEARDAWAAIAQYNGFIASHRELYHRVVPVAKIALMSRGEENPLADAFIKANVLFETKVFEHLGKGTPLNHFRVLVIPFPIKKLQDEPRDVLAGFIAAGGKIFSPDPEDLAEALGPGSGASITAIPKKTLSSVQAGEPVPALIEPVEKAAGGAILALENDRYLVAHVTKKADADTFIIHLINYDHQVPHAEVKVKLDLSGYLPEAGGFTLRAFSPDEPAPSVTGLSLHRGICEFTIGPIPHYAVVVLSSRQI
jgi:hypothetical protein